MNKVVHYKTWGGFEACKFPDAKVVFNSKSSYDSEINRITCSDCHKKMSYECNFCKNSGVHLSPDVAEPIETPCSKKGCEFRSKDE